jgi:HAD superfamily hydrolase (TIGR01549 family)
MRSEERPQHRIEAILFDLDDTLRDWRRAIEGAVDTVIAEAGLVDGSEVRERLWIAIEEHCVVWRDGMVMDRAYWKLLYESERVIASALPERANSAASLAAIFRGRLRPPLFADTVPALAALSSSYRLGILSNNPRAGDAVERLGLSQYFAAVVGLDPAHGKPRPEAFQQGCEALDTTSAGCAYVGDSYENDVWGAASAGLFSIWLDREGFDYPLPPGTVRVATLEQVAPILESGDYRTIVEDRTA